MGRQQQLPTQPRVQTRIARSLACLTLPPPPPPLLPLKFGPNTSCCRSFHSFTPHVLLVSPRVPLGAPVFSPMAGRPGYNQLNPFSNQPQYARQYSDSDAESYTSRNASSVPLAPAGYYDGTYTPQCEYFTSGFPCARPRRPSIITRVGCSNLSYDLVGPNGQCTRLYREQPPVGCQQPCLLHTT